MPAVAGLFALVELAVAVFPGGFVDRDRAELATFLAVRPWLLAGLAALLLRLPWRRRFVLLGAALAMATVTELGVVWLLDAPILPSLSDAARGLVAGIGLGAALIAVAGLARPVPIAPRLLAFALALALLMLPGPLGFYQRLAVGGEPPPLQTSRPQMLIWTRLPLLWGEADPADPVASAAARPAATDIIERAFALAPIDGPGGLDGGRFVLLAQAGPMPAEWLVAIDAWVRGGGRALILADPALDWPSALPLGDQRRPPADHGLGPLLTHWGVSMEIATGAKGARDIGPLRIAMPSPGRISVIGQTGCTVGEDALVADCAIGKGRALILADADLLADRRWRGPGAIGAERIGRLADNPQLIIALLDRLRDEPGDRPQDIVRWARGPLSAAMALLIAAVFPLALLTMGVARRDRP